MDIAGSNSDGLEDSAEILFILTCKHLFNSLIEGRSDIDEQDGLRCLHLCIRLPHLNFNFSKPKKVLPIASVLRSSSEANRSLNMFPRDSTGAFSFYQRNFLTDMYAYICICILIYIYTYILHTYMLISIVLLFIYI